MRTSCKYLLTSQRTQKEMNRRWNHKK